MRGVTNVVLSLRVRLVRSATFKYIRAEGSARGSIVRLIHIWELQYKPDVIISAEFSWT